MRELSMNIMNNLFTQSFSFIMEHKQVGIDGGYVTQFNSCVTLSF